MAGPTSLAHVRSMFLVSQLIFCPVKKNYNFIKNRKKYPCVATGEGYFNRIIVRFFFYLKSLWDFLF
jgi:hypothetical protein